MPNATTAYRVRRRGPSRARRRAAPRARRRRVLGPRADPAPPCLGQRDRSPRAPDERSRSTHAQARPVEVAVISPPITTEMLAVSSDTTTTTRVGLLGDADRRAVPRAEAFGQVLPQRQREDAAGVREPAVLDHHGAVVQRRVRQEDRHQEVLRDGGVERRRRARSCRRAASRARARSARRRGSARASARRARSPRGSATPPLRATFGNTPRPTRASARRMSFWNSTMMMRTADERKWSRIHDSVASWNSCDPANTVMSSRSPIRICTARVPLISKSSQYTPRATMMMSTGSVRQSKFESKKLQTVEQDAPRVLDHRSPPVGRRARRRARPTRAARTPAAPSCTRSPSAPASTAAAQAAAVASSRRPTGSPGQLLEEGLARRTDDDRQAEPLARASRRSRAARGCLPGACRSRCPGRPQCVRADTPARQAIATDSASSSATSARTSS